MRKSTQKNKLFTHTFMFRIERDVKQARALAAMAAFSAAIRETWQDSGRFAGNWRITVGASSHDMTIRRRGTGPIGYRRENRGQSDTRVWYSLMAEAEIPASTDPKAMTQGTFFARETSRKGGLPTLRITNPLYITNAVTDPETGQAPYKFFAAENRTNVKEAVRKAIDTAIAAARALPKGYRGVGTP